MLTQKKFERYTGIRVVLNVPYEQKPVMIEHITRMNKIINYASKVSLPFMQNETLVKDKDGTDIVLFTKLKRTSQSQKGSLAQKYLSELAPIKNYMNELGYSLSRIERMAYGMAAKFYTGMDTRNGNHKIERYESKNAPMTGNLKSIHYLDGMAQFVHIKQGDELEFSNPRNNKLAQCKTVRVKIKTYDKDLILPFCVRSSQQKYLQKFMNEKMSGACNSNPAIEGNLVAELKFKQDGSIDVYKTTFHFVVLVKISELYSYDAEEVIGIDFNQRKDVFVVFSDESIPNINVHNQVSFNDLIKQRQNIQQQIADTRRNVREKQKLPFINSRERRKLRLRWFELDKLIDKEIASKKYAKTIVDIVESRQALLAIDDIALSDKAGFGHYQLKRAIIQECNTRKIPYVLVETRHTSTDCNYCFQTTNKYVQTGRSDNQELVSCNTCKQVYNADTNAAKNIADDGKYIWNNEKTGKRKQFSNRPTSKNRNVRPKFNDYRFDNDINF